MLYCFDMDGTLVSNYMDNPDKDYHTWRVLPGRVEKLRQIQERGDTITIVTNQGGVAFGHVTEQEAWNKIDAAALACGLRPDTIRTYVCFDDARGLPRYSDPERAARRKPSGAMIREAINDYPDAASYGVLMVGDRSEDEAAARDAGVSFQWAHIFFGE